MTSYGNHPADDESRRPGRGRRVGGHGRFASPSRRKPEYITLCRLALTGLSRRARAVRRRRSPTSSSPSPRPARTRCATRIREGGGVVEILYDLQPDRLVIEVADDGEGFEPGSRSTTTTTTCPRAASGSRSSGRSPTSSRSTRGATDAARDCASSSSCPREPRPAMPPGRFEAAPRPDAPARQRRTQVAWRLRHDRHARADGRDPPARRAAARASASSTSRRRRSAAASPRSTTR